MIRKYIIYNQISSYYHKTLVRLVPFGHAHLSDAKIWEEKPHLGERSIRPKLSVLPILLKTLKLDMCFNRINTETYEKNSTIIPGFSINISKNSTIFRIA